MQEIERDLVRWHRGKWIAVIAFIFLAQVGLIIWGSQRRVRERRIYPSEPRVALAPSLKELDREWLALENPFLFASASWKGFSEEAWLRQPKWEMPTPTVRSSPKFLQLAEARELNSRHDANRSFSLRARRRATAVLPEPAPPSSQPRHTSELRLAGFGDRGLAAPLPLPVQHHSDVLSSTVVEALVDRDGLVITARVIENSGSARADADALALARRARFAPVRLADNVAEAGKLIFEWFALHLSDTNNVER